MLEAVNAATATNAASPLTTPTYDGSGQAVHPSVVDVGAGQTWNGHRYWMAMTPYFNSDDVYENPSILVSDDKVTWTVPDGLTNPLVAPPEGADFYFDPDLYLLNGTMYLVYCYRNPIPTIVDYLYLKTSINGIDWSDPIELMHGGKSQCSSPSLVHDGTKWLLFYRDEIADPVNNTLYVKTATILTGAWSEATALVFDIITAHSHLDIILSGGVYYGLFLDANYKLYFAGSLDGINWYRKFAPILTPGTWDAFGFYRSTLVPNATGFDMWYTGKADLNDWRIGYTTIIYTAP